MNINLFNKFTIVMCLLFVGTIIISSCGGEEEPEGEAANLKFIGDYVGEVSCAGALAAVINDPALSFNISDTSPATDNTVQVNLPSLPIPLELTGTVSGNNVNMDETKVNDVMVPFGGISVSLDVTANGDAKLVGNALTANIFLSSTGDITATDECTIVANKQ